MIAVSKIVGIDLGTTNSAVACMEENGPRLIPNALGEVLTPSVVGVDADGKLLVGRAAKELQVLQPERCVGLFKRRMGSDWHAELSGRKFSAEELSSLILGALKEDAAVYFKAPVERAVITVPAYFDDHQRKATIAAGRIAGLQVERIFNEPTAAALAYGFHEARDEKILLIFDLGGGTFDVSVVELFEGTLEVRASSGESFLGGEDFTRTLAARLLEQHGHPFELAELQAPLMVARVLQQCERAKCSLSRQESFTLRIPDRKGEYHDSSPEATITRQQFEAWTQHILNRVDLPIRRVLGDAKLTRDDVDEVILVGGATRMPAVIDRVTQLLGKSPHRRFNPDQVVALGAAVQAGLIARDQSVEDLVVTDVAPFTLGIMIAKNFGHEQRSGYFLPVIQRNSTIPTSRVERVVTTAANQTTLQLKIYQGEGRRVEDNLFLGEFEVKGVPPGPAGQPVDVRFTYDLNGVLEVEAAIVETKKSVSHVVTRHARGLSAKQIAEAVKQMEKFKTHPREEAVNRLLLRRAERLYQELPLEGRVILGQLLDGFEDALAKQNEEAIDRNRTPLQEFIERADAGWSDNGTGNDDDDWYKP
jgi:molecular chaperone HscC